MKLFEIEQEAKRSAKRRFATHNYNRDLAIADVKCKKNEIPRLSLTVYREPKNCHFNDTVYWQAVYFPKNKRMYLIYSDNQNGYKANNQSSKKIVGHIEFPNQNLHDALTPFFERGKRVFFNWQWDSECGRPFIEII